MMNLLLFALTVFAAGSLAGLFAGARLARRVNR